ncbi:hypothetical protein D0Y65_005554 [Glycine soja]|uniref:Uncharacterized protein n=1 Tax=Glycine soja TaxID=3848 RepID=A0A445LWA5_GLYSO|nr:hypothetical protein D0Y65_005554 [Glycine soja]
MKASGRRKIDILSHVVPLHALQGKTIAGENEFGSNNENHHIDHVLILKNHLHFIHRLNDLNKRFPMWDWQEAIAAYPYLWNACEKFSERFQAWMLKTLADMLLFLGIESTVSVTPEREKEFHKLCDEAVQLGFERLWIDEMHAHLTHELRSIQNELKSLNDFVDGQTKCFNFL